MTLTLNNFWGAETGGMEEAASFSGVSADGSVKHSGGYSYKFSGSAQSLVFNTFDEVGSGGTGIILGFWYRTPASFDSQTDVLKHGFSGYAFTIRQNTNGTLSVLDKLGTARITTTALSVSVEYFIEVYVEETPTGAAEIFIDKVSAGTTSGQDFGVSSSQLVSDSLSSTQTWYLDDIYFLSGATSSAQRLGPCNVYSYRSNLNSATPDVGSVLSSGTWLAVQSVPFSASVAAFYSSTGQGRVTTNDVGGSAGTGGPNTDANITGALVGYKGIWRAERGNGGTTQHYGVLSRSSVSSDFRCTTRALNLPTTVANYTKVLSTIGWNPGVMKAAYTPGNTGSYYRGGLHFSADGLKFWLGITNGLAIKQYTLSSAWDLSTASGPTASKTFADITGTEWPRDAAWSSDGAELYVGTWNSTPKIHQYHCTTSYDITTAGTVVGTFSIGASVFGLVVTNSDSYVLTSSSTTTIDRYTMSTAKDITTCGSLITLNVSSVFSAVDDVKFTSDGTILMVAGNLLNESLSYAQGIAVYNLVTAWDISTATLLNVVRVVAAANASIYSLYIYEDGKRIIASGHDGSGGEIFTLWDIDCGSVLSASEYAQIGFEQQGAQDFECYGMLATVLHVPAAAGKAFPPYKPRSRFQHMLMR